MDRIRLAILKLAARSGNGEDAAFELARVDWRDLFMAAGFGHDAGEHDNWYRQLTKNAPNRK